MRTRGLLAASLVVVLSGCGAEEPAPDKPTWAKDVLPILRANCFHCHGAAADSIRSSTKAGIFRWDIYDLTEQGYADIGWGEVMEPPDNPQGLKTFRSAKTPLNFATLLIYVGPEAPADARMPPPPALPLSARDFQVLENWSKTGYTKGSHGPNARATISWLEKGKTFQVLDGNGDQVLGRLDCGGVMVQIPRSGTHTLPEDADPPCMATLYDGFATSTSELK